MKKILPALVVLVGLSASASETPLSCRAQCTDPLQVGCLKFGLAAQSTYAPYIGIILGAQSKQDGEIAKICGQTVAQASDKISIVGPACDFYQVHLGMSLKSHFPGNTSALKVMADDEIAIHFDMNRPSFEFLNQDGSYLTHGEVEFLTSAKEASGKLVAVWFNGETCISALSNRLFRWRIKSLILSFYISEIF